MYGTEVFLCKSMEEKWRQRGRNKSLWDGHKWRPNGGENTDRVSLGGEGKDSKIQSFSLFLIEFSFILLYVDKNLSLKFYRMYRLI